jgi:SMI1 / KNR4 family (SUKH-1)
VLKKLTFYKEFPPCTAEDFAAFERERGKPVGKSFREFCEQCRGGTFLSERAFRVEPHFAKPLRKSLCIEPGDLLAVKKLHSLHEGNQQYATRYWTAFLRDRQDTFFPSEPSLFVIASDSMGNYFAADITEDEPWVHYWDGESGMTFTVATSLAGFYNGLIPSPQE